MNTTCPLCGTPCGDNHQVTVCKPCHNTLAASASTITATGEFSSAQVMAAINFHPDESLAPAPIVGGVVCSWCSKPGESVKKILSHGEIKLCNECVGLCASVMAAELGNNWQNS